LRSPFNGILGITEILAEELEAAPSSKQYKMVETLNQSAKKLFHLLENLLQWAHLQQVAPKAHPEYLPLASTAYESIQTILEIADKKDITLINNIPESVYVFADRLMLESIIRNLVWNAFKFTPNGGKVWIGAEKESDKMIAVSISDNGIGMNAKILENLFHFDKSINRPGTGGEPSSGLGLMICKEFLEQNRGEIRVESEEGKGSTFTFTLPSN
jgi:signal transduction histidine kinase